MNAKTKLQMLLTYTGENKASLGRKINQVAQTFYDIEKEKIKSFSPEVVKKIKKIYPEINEDFFLFDSPSLIVNSSRISNEDFLSHLPEPPKLENGTKQEALNALKIIQSKKEKEKPKNFNGGEIENDEDLVPQKVIDIPIDGFASLKKAFFADDYIQQHFKERIEYVRPEERIADFLYRVRVMKNNFSMTPNLNPGDLTYSESISEQFWLIENQFNPEKIYQLWHSERGILFKRISKHNITKGLITLSSDNEDKNEYPDEDFSLWEFRKILVVRKKEVIF